MKATFLRPIILCAAVSLAAVNPVFVVHADDGWASQDDSLVSLGNLQGILGNIFNIAVLAAAAVLVAVEAYGIWKSSLATGDPRGLEGAKQTWTYALFGFAVIVLFFTIFGIVASLFGITSLGDPKSILGEVFRAIEDLVSVPQR